MALHLLAPSRYNYIQHSKKTELCAHACKEIGKKDEKILKELIIPPKISQHNCKSLQISCLGRAPSSNPTEHPYPHSSRVEDRVEHVRVSLWSLRLPRSR